MLIFSVLGKQLPTTCPCLNVPENGHVFPVADGKSFVFTCNAGYIIVGEFLLTCNNGMWNAPEPKCKFAG